MRLKVEGIRECGDVLVAALMDRREEHIFGRRILPEMDIASMRWVSQTREDCYTSLLHCGMRVQAFG